MHIAGRVCPFDEHSVVNLVRRQRDDEEAEQGVEVVLRWTAGPTGAGLKVVNRETEGPLEGCNDEEREAGSLRRSLAETGNYKRGAERTVCESVK